MKSGCRFFVPLSCALEVWAYATLQVAAPGLFARVEQQSAPRLAECNAQLERRGADDLAHGPEALGHADDDGRRGRHGDLGVAAGDGEGLEDGRQRLDDGARAAAEELAGARVEDEDDGRLAAAARVASTAI